MYPKSFTRQAMQREINSLKLQLEQSRQNHECAVKQIREDQLKEIGAIQDEIKKNKEIMSNVQFQQYFKIKCNNTKLLSENAMLRDMLKAGQIANSTKEFQVTTLKKKVRKIEGQSLEVRKEHNSQFRQNEYYNLRKYLNNRHSTQPSLNESNLEPSLKLLPIKFQINQ